MGRLKVCRAAAMLLALSVAGLAASWSVPALASAPPGDGFLTVLVRYRPAMG